MLKDERMDMKVVKYSVAFLNNQVEMSSSTYLNIPSASLLETVTRVDKHADVKHFSHLPLCQARNSDDIVNFDLVSIADFYPLVIHKFPCNAPIPLAVAILIPSSRLFIHIKLACWPLLHVFGLLALTSFKEFKTIAG